MTTGLVCSTGNNSSTLGATAKRKSLSWRETSVPWERSVDVPSPTLGTNVGRAWRIHLPGQRIVKAKGPAGGSRSDEAARGSTKVSTPSPPPPRPSPPDSTDGRSTHAGEWSLRSNTSENAAVRPLDRPAPTMMFGARLNSMHWERTPR